MNKFRAVSPQSSGTDSDHFNSTNIINPWQDYNCETISHVKEDKMLVEFKKIIPNYNLHMRHAGKNQLQQRDRVLKPDLGEILL